MPECSIVIGGAGTGKTTHLMGIMDKVLASGVSPYQVGFCSFTRAARREAAERAAERFGETAESLERDGWFKTLHSICCSMIGVGKSLLADTKDSREWIEEAIGESVQVVGSSTADEWSARSDADYALMLWNCARARMEPLEPIWYQAQRVDINAPSWNIVEHIVERYERQKNLDDRSDFTDVLLRYTGHRARISGCSKTRPEGDVPQVPVWFFDECQDNSALTDAVARRLSQDSKWVYLVGDEFQSIYGFAGSDSRYFKSWPAPESRRRILAKTYRCPAPIHRLGESRLRECSDYWDRGIQPADHDGRLEFLAWESPWPEMITPGESWLLIARSNFQVQRFIKRLNAWHTSIPWKSTGHYGSRWDAPARNSAILAAMTLLDGAPITDAEWKHLVKTTPATYLERGQKKHWSNRSLDGDLNNLAGIESWGAKPEFREYLATGAWMDKIEHSREVSAAIRKFGWDAVSEPTIRVGTIHSVKGAEADNVMMLTTTSRHVELSKEDEEKRNEEHRIEYVGITRARRNLWIVGERDPANSMDIDGRDVKRCQSSELIST